MAPPRDINEIRQRIADAGHPDPWGVSDAEAIAAYNRAATPNEQYGSGGGGGGYPGGPTVVGGIDWFNSIDASSYRKAMQELARQQFELDKAQQEFIAMPNAESERKWRDAQTAYDQGRLALDQARLGFDQTKYGTDTQMDIWKQQVRMAEQRAAGTGVYFAPSGNPTMPPAYQDLTKVTMEKPMAPDQEGAQLAAVKAQVNAATRAKTGRDMSEAEWRTWLTGRVDPELAQQMMAADQRAGRQPSDRSGKNVFDLGWFNGAEHTALYSQLPDRYQSQIEQTTGWAITPQGPAKAGSTTTLTGATLPAPAQPRTFQPAYGGGSPQPGSGATGIPDTGMRPVGSKLSVGNTVEPEYENRNFGMEPGGGGDRTLPGEGASPPPPGGYQPGQYVPGRGILNQDGSYGEIYMEQQPGRYGAQQPGSSGAVNQPDRQQGPLPNWQAAVAAGSNSQPGGYGNPNPYAGQLDYVFDPRTGQWGERQLGDRAQSLSEWEALKQQEYNDAMMKANPANYALVQAMQGGSSWQQPQGQTGQQPSNWQAQVAAGSAGQQPTTSSTGWAGIGGGGQPGGVTTQSTAGNWLNPDSAYRQQQIDAFNAPDQVAQRQAFQQKLDTGWRPQGVQESGGQMTPAQMAAAAGGQQGPGGFSYRAQNTAQRAQPGQMTPQQQAAAAGGQRSLAAPSGREFSLGQYSRLRPDQKAVFGSAVKASGRTEDDWLDEAKRYAPNQRSGGASQGRWR